MDDMEFKPGPFGEGIDVLARDRGGWASTKMVYAVEVIGEGQNPQVLLTGSDATWMPRAKRWKFNAAKPCKAVVLLSEYRAALTPSKIAESAS